MGRRKDILAVAFLAAVIAVLSAGILSGQHGLGPEAHLDADGLFGTGAHPALRPFDDLTPLVIEAPRDHWMLGRARAGHFDLWNPLQGTGVPLSPDQGGLWSPLRLVPLLVPGQAGYVLFHVIRLWIAAAGTYFLARARGASRRGALAGGLVFGIGGGMVAQLPFVSTGPICFLPWVVFAQARLLARPSAGRRALLGLTVALALTGGHPTLAAVVLIGAAFAGLGQVWENGRRGLLDLCAGWAFGAAFAAPYLLSFGEYLAHGYSYKHTAIGGAEHHTWVDFTRRSLGVGVAAPATLDALRDVASERAYPYLLHFVTGTTALVLAAAGVLRRRGLDLLLPLAAGLFLSFEPRDLSHVPVLGDILARYYWPLVALPIAAAAAQGVDTLSRPEGLRRLPWAILLFALIVAAALAQPTPFVRGPVPEAARNAAPGYHLAVIAAIAAALAAGRLFRRPGATAGGLLLVAAAELVFLMRPHLREPRSEALRRPLPPAVQHLAEETPAAHARMIGAPLDLALAALPSLAGIPDLRMTAPLVPDRYAAFLDIAGQGGGFTLFTLARAPTPWSALAGVRFVAAAAPVAAGLRNAPGVVVRDPLPGGGAVLESRTAAERARLFFGAEVAKNRDDAASRLRALGARQGLGDRVILEPIDAAPAPLSGSGTARVSWIKDDPDEVVLSTEASSPAYLVLADTFYPGWQAAVDGASAPIFPADVGFRAVAVPEGKHTVRFVYRPRPVGGGLLVAGVAAAAALLMIRRERQA